MSLNQILRYGVIGGIFLIPFIALIVTKSMFFPFITGKNFVFRILVELLLGGWIILAIRDARYRPKFSWLLAALVVFVGVITIADIFSENPFKSFWSNFERMEGLVTLFHLLAYFIVLGTMLSTEKLWTWFFNTSIGVSIVMGLYGLGQLMGFFVINQGGVRLDATLGNATYLGVYMIFHIFLTIFLLFKWRGGQFMQWVYSAALLLQIVILYFTATRGAILGLIGGLLLTFFLIAIFEKERKQFRKIAISLTIAVVAFVGVFVLFKETDFVKNDPVLRRFSFITLSEFNTRFQVWNMGYQGFKERPILGWGQESFNFVFNKYYDPKMYEQEQWFDRVHNIFFDWLIAGGILGLLSYLSLYFISLYYIWFRNRERLSVVTKSLFTGLLAAYFFHNLFVFDNITSYILFFAVLAYLHHIYSHDFKKLPTSFIVRPGIAHHVISSVVIVLLAGTLYFVNVSGILAARTLLTALSPQQEGVGKNLEYFKTALAYNTFGNQEIREQLIQGAVRIAANQNIDLSLKQEFYDLARNEMIAQSEQVPNDARFHLFLGSFYRNFGQHDLAIAELENTLEFTPRKQSALFELGQVYLAQGNYEKAHDVFKIAYELEPSFNTARVMYAVSAVYLGKDGLVEELLVPVYGSVLLDNDFLVQAYFTTGQNQKVLEIWKARVATNPNNAQYHLSLGAAYLQVNDRAMAIAEIEKVIELSPEFKEQGEFFIREIQAGRNP